MRRHDLLRVDPEAWQAMLEQHPGLEAVPLVADWASRHWPVIVRRRMCSDVPGRIPAALPLPPRHGKQRIAFSLAAGAGIMKLPAMLLGEAAPVAPASWQPAIAALLRLGRSIGSAPRVFGALLWERATGLAYLSERSDLDLLWEIADDGAAAALLAGLRQIDSESPVRLDGELELPNGAGVNWRELAQAVDDSRADVLMKSMDGVATRPIATLFQAAMAA
jgi:phosphoribosyl-dephospho-CoA transferase